MACDTVDVEILPHGSQLAFERGHRIFADDPCCLHEIRVQSDFRSAGFDFAEELQVVNRERIIIDIVCQKAIRSRNPKFFIHFEKRWYCVVPSCRHRAEGS